MPNNMSMKKKTLSLSPHEGEFLDRRSTDLSVTENEYLRRLLGIGSAIASLRTPEDGMLDSTIRVELVATRGNEVVGRHQVSGLLI